MFIYDLWKNNISLLYGAKKNCTAQVKEIGKSVFAPEICINLIVILCKIMYTLLSKVETLVSELLMKRAINLLLLKQEPFKAILLY